MCIYVDVVVDVVVVLDLFLLFFVFTMKILVRPLLDLLGTEQPRNRQMK